MLSRNLIVLTMSVMALACTRYAHTDTGDIPYRGVNLSGAEFGGCTKEAKYGFKYIYPQPGEFDYFMALGMNTFRIPFCWERLQKTALGEFDAAELEHLDSAVRYATAKNAYVILDPHDYGGYWGKPLGAGTDNAVFADFWRRLATQYRDNDRVIFGLMNEPHGITSETWLSAANAAIAAIRKSGAKNLVLVPGTAWTGAHSWTSNHYGTPNAVSMLNVKDPANNYAYEVHQYFDNDSSGTKPDCVGEDTGVKRIAELSNWLKANHKKAVLAEFGAAKNSTCYAAVLNLLTAMHKNPDIWLGWTYWSASPWTPNYMFALPLHPQAGEASQLDVLKKFLTPPLNCAPNCANPNPPILKSTLPTQ